MMKHASTGILTLITLAILTTDAGAFGLPTDESGVTTTVGWQQGSVMRTFERHDERPYQLWAGTSLSLLTFGVAPEIGLGNYLRDGERYDLRLTSAFTLPMTFLDAPTAGLGAHFGLMSDFDNKRLDVTLGPRAEFSALVAGGEQGRLEATLFSGLGVPIRRHRLWLQLETGYAFSGASGALVARAALALEWRVKKP
jgi:hypothetical protein